MGIGLIRVYIIETARNINNDLHNLLSMKEQQVHPFFCDCCNS